MRAFQHPTNNRMLGAPEDWDQSQERCDALPITDVALPNGTPCIVSFWMPSAEELAELNAGAAIALHIVGQTMPPVAIGTQP